MREKRSSLRAPFSSEFPQDLVPPRAFSAVFVPFPHFFLPKINLYFRQESVYPKSTKVLTVSHMIHVDFERFYQKENNGFNIWERQNAYWALFFVVFLKVERAGVNFGPFWNDYS